MNIELAPTDISIDLTNDYHDAQSYAPHSSSASHDQHAGGIDILNWEPRSHPPTPKRPPQPDEHPDEQRPAPPPPPPTTTFIYVLKLVLTHFTITVFTIVLYFTTESLVNAVQNITEPVWMLDAPLCRTIFYICCLGSATSFTITSNGLAINSYRYLPTLMVQSVVLLSIVLMLVQPSIHQQSSLPIRTKVGRANCSDPMDISKAFQSSCPTFRPNASFVQSSSTRSSEDTQIEQDKKNFEMIQRFEGATDFFPILAQTVISDVEGIGYVPLLQNQECIWKFVDVACEFNFQRCNYHDCSNLGQVNSTLLTCGQQSALETWLECGKKQCLLTPGCDTRTQNSIPSLKIILDKIVRVVLNVNEKLFDESTTIWFKSFFQQLKDEFDREENFLGCTGWEQRYIASDKDSSNPNNNQTSCNPKITTYEKENNTITFDSGQLLLVLNVSFIGIIGLFLSRALRNETRAFQSTLHVTSPRISCFFIAIVMSMLVYIGALELERAAALNQDDTTQTIWSAFYFAVSFLCFHGGIHLLILVEGTAAKKQASKDTSSGGDRHPCIEKIMAFKTEFMDAHGKWFPLKLVLLEMFEMTIQLYSLMSSSQNSDAAEVTISATLLALNLMVLPVVTVVAGVIFKSATSIVAATLIMGVAVLLRPDTITEFDLSVVEQLARHGGCLIPALMTSLDIDDALVLAAHVEQEALVTTEIRFVPSSKASKLLGLPASRTSRTMAKLNQDSQKSKIFLTVAAAMSFIIGFGLGLFTLVTFVTQDQLCHDQLGSIASCARPRYYFSNGLFGETSCAWPSTRKIHCLDNVIKTAVTLPDANLEYSQMTSLTDINISNYPLLKNVPNGFGLIPNPAVTLTLTDNPQLSRFPYSICVSDNVSNIDLARSNASKYIDWNQQIHQHSLWTDHRRLLKPIYINRACGAALYNSVEVLNLANNSLSCDATDYDGSHARRLEECTVMGLSKFIALRHIILDDNDFTVIGLPVVSNLIHIVSRENEDGIVSFENNKVQQIKIGAYKKLETKRWLSTVLNTYGLEQITSIDLRGAIISYEDLVDSKSLLLTETMNSIVKFEFDTVTPKWKHLHSLFRGKSTLVQIGASNAGLTNIDNEFEGLHHLCQLRLDHNELTSLNIKEGFRNSNVTFDKQFCSESNVFTSQFAFLSLNYNQIYDLQDSLVSLVGLQKLSLQGNFLNRLHFSELPKQMADLVVINNNISVFNVSELKSLVRVSIQGNQLMSLKRSMLAGPDNGVRLRQFSAAGNKLTNVDVDAFENMENLYIIDLSRNELSEIDIDMFRRIQAKAWGNSLYFDYDHNELRDTGCIDLSGNRFNASMKSAVLDYFVRELGFVKVDVGSKYYRANYDTVKHKTGTFRVIV